VLAGITDEAVDDSPDVPVPDESEIGWILSTLSTALGRPLSDEDVIGRFAGIRPLVDDSDEDESSADISRRHLVQKNESGLITVTGGKLTTYRRMAQDAVDLITDADCVTTGVALVGVDDTVEKDTRLNRRFGAEGAIVAELAAMSSLFAEPVTEGAPVIGAEVAWAVLSEGALDAADIIERRTRLSLVDEWGIGAQTRVAEILSQVTS
jgi:glycerol-3-phosphate dehydrogenase